MSHINKFYNKKEMRLKINMEKNDLKNCANCYYCYIYPNYSGHFCNLFEVTKGKEGCDDLQIYEVCDCWRFATKEHRKLSYKEATIKLLEEKNFYIVLEVEVGITLEEAYNLARDLICYYEPKKWLIKFNFNDIICNVFKNDSIEDFPEFKERYNKKYGK